MGTIGLDFFFQKFLDDTVDSEYLNKVATTCLSILYHKAWFDERISLSIVGGHARNFESYTGDIDIWIHNDRTSSVLGELFQSFSKIPNIRYTYLSDNNRKLGFESKGRMLIDITETIISTDIFQKQTRDIASEKSHSAIIPSQLPTFQSATPAFWINPRFKAHHFPSYQN